MSTADAYFVCLSDGRRFGPVPMAVLEQWAREGRVPASAMLEMAEGSSPPRPVQNEPRLMAIIAAPPTVAGVISVPAADNGVSTLIPYKNSAALVGYYISVGAMIPIIGLLLGPIAMVLGIIGMRRYYRDPAIKGIAHAWVAIVLGGLCTLGYGAILVLMIVGIASR